MDELSAFAVEEEVEFRGEASVSAVSVAVPDGRRRFPARLRGPRFSAACATTKIVRRWRMMQRASG